MPLEFAAVHFDTSWDLTLKSSAEVYLPPDIKVLEYLFLFLFCSHIYKK